MILLSYVKPNHANGSVFLLQKKIQKMKINYLTQMEVDNCLRITDLSDEINGKHAINIMMNEIKNGIASKYNIEPTIIRNFPIVSTKDNYDNLYYPQDTITKSSRYTRWVDENTILRTQVTSGVPNTLKTHTGDDVIYLLPGLVYRRDVIDKTHVGEPHQCDIWRVSSLHKYTREDLLDLVNTVVNSILPGSKWRYNETNHYYTDDGIEVEVLKNGEWLEILECGVIPNKLLEDNGLDPSVYSGLALGLGLDRSVMIRKQINDIRLLRHPDPRIAKQMLNLDSYKEVSSYPHVNRDISIAIPIDMDDELLGDEIRTLIDKSDWIEEIVIKSETLYENLPKIAIERLGIDDTMKNVLVGIRSRALDHTLVKEEVNHVIEQLYIKIHRGTRGYVNLNV